ncbi:MAG: hypothetical protein WD403_10035 [Pirellulales bacterium]
MLTETLLNGYLGKHISQICPNAFHADSENHCAHFVSHVLNLSFGMTCGHLVAGSQRKGPAGNVRVQELFAQCPNARELDVCPQYMEALIFVSAPRNFQTGGSRPVLANVQNKHIGLFLNGQIWHYSNSRRQVIQQILAQFIHHYPQQQNALWVGDLPITASVHHP